MWKKKREKCKEKTKYSFHGMSRACFEIGLEGVVAIPSKLWVLRLVAVCCFIPAPISASTLGWRQVEMHLQSRPRHARDKERKFLAVLAIFISGSGRNCYIYRMFSHFEHFPPSSSHFKMMHLMSNKCSNLCKSGDSLFSETFPAQTILPIPL